MSEPIVARLVQPGDFVSGTVVAVRPGEVDLKVESGLYSPGTVVTVRVKPVITRDSWLVYEVVKPDAEPRDWELMAPLVAAAAVLVALGRGDEIVEDYRDGTPTALELLAELVEAAQ